ncbi:MAG: hypothetical protein IKU01_02660 [Bacteroidales bacterium]|nr:hypothetical protein [Bacteroidales bacterium]
MHKRSLIATMLFAALFFSSCSLKKDVTIPDGNRAVAYEYMTEDAEEVVLPDSEQQSLNSGGVPYEELKRRHYEMQSDVTKKMMKENEKRSKRDTPIKKKSLFNFGKKKSCMEANDAVIKDGVRDVK